MASPNAPHSIFYHGQNLENLVVSIVIVQIPQGYKASLRFKNKAYDCEIARQSRYILFADVERYVCGR